MGRTGRSLGPVSGAMACFFCIVLLVTVATESTGGTKATPPLGFQGTSRGRPNAHLNLDPLYAIKRRVPNGPDPIHNRRAGKSGRPPGRA